jgi:hypothetical protein
MASFFERVERVAIRTTAFNAIVDGATSRDSEER